MGCFNFIPAAVGGGMVVVAALAEAALCVPLASAFGWLQFRAVGASPQRRHWYVAQRRTVSAVQSGVVAALVCATALLGAWCGALAPARIPALATAGAVAAAVGALLLVGTVRPTPYPGRRVAVLVSMVVYAAHLALLAPAVSPFALAAASAFPPADGSGGPPGPAAVPAGEPLAADAAGEGAAAVVMGCGLRKVDPRRAAAYVAVDVLLAASLAAVAFLATLPTLARALSPPSSSTAAAAEGADSVALMPGRGGDGPRRLAAEAPGEMAAEMVDLDAAGGGFGARASRLLGELRLPELRLPAAPLASLLRASPFRRAGAAAAAPPPPLHPTWRSELPPPAAGAAEAHAEPAAAYVHLRAPPAPPREPPPV